MVRGWSSRGRASVPRTSPRRALLLLIAAFTVVAASCAAPPPPPGVPRLLVFGDSISVLGSEALAKALPEYALTVNATWGASIEDRLEASATAAATHPNIVVINLGTNDAWSTDEDDPFVDPAISAANLQTMVGSFNGSCVILVEVHLGHPVVGSFSSASVNAINTKESSLTPRVVHWNTMGDVAGNIAEDGVHPSPAGQTALASLIRDEAQACDS